MNEFGKITCYDSAKLGKNTCLNPSKRTLENVYRIHLWIDIFLQVKNPSGHYNNLNVLFT